MGKRKQETREAWWVPGNKRWIESTKQQYAVKPAAEWKIAATVRSVAATTDGAAQRA
jgi:hypothetical protein